MGLTLELALGTEGIATINVETWKKALKAHPEFQPHYHEAKGRFLEMAVRRLADSEELANLKWLLERRFAGLFGKPDADGLMPGQSNVTVNNTVAVGIPDDVVQRAKQLAAEELEQLKPGKGAKHG